LSGLLAGAGAPGSQRLGLRVDGYWFVPFLRAEGQELVPGLEPDRAARALTAFAAAFAPIGPGLVLGPDEERREADLFQDGRLAMSINGPWAVHQLSAGAPDDLVVAPLPRGPEGALAPRGGALWVVPRCAERAASGWALAGALTEPALAANWSRRFGTVPSTRPALQLSSPLVRAPHRALVTAAGPLPADPLTPMLFDDLTPAIWAVVAKEATAEEALAGVRRAWHRLERRGVRL
jgi:arabinogalactan oligomer/maltooligosaccharide transport system substrate-binding protein